MAINTYEICFVERSVRYVHVRAKTAENAAKRFKAGDVDLGESFDYGDFEKDVIKSVTKITVGETWRS